MKMIILKKYLKIIEIIFLLQRIYIKKILSIVKLKNYKKKLNNFLRKKRILNIIKRNN